MQVKKKQTKNIYILLCAFDSAACCRQLDHYPASCLGQSFTQLKREGGGQATLTGEATRGNLNVLYLKILKLLEID